MCECVSAAWCNTQGCRHGSRAVVVQWTPLDTARFVCRKAVVVPWLDPLDPPPYLLATAVTLRRAQHHQNAAGNLVQFTCAVYVRLWQCLPREVFQCCAVGGQWVCQGDWLAIDHDGCAQPLSCAVVHPHQ